MSFYKKKTPLLEIIETPDLCKLQLPHFHKCLAGKQLRGATLPHQELAKPCASEIGHLKG